MTATKPKPTEQGQPGDLIVIEGHRVGDPQRTGEILEVLEGASGPHYRVRWEDGHEAVFYPSGGFSIRRRTKKTAT